jgi:tetratricopeptide (TPR) repeat protein
VTHLDKMRNAVRNAVPTARSAFENGDYQAVITLLTDHADLKAEPLTWLGVSYLRCGQFNHAGPLLSKAALLGSLEAAVEAANLTRALEQPEHAIAQFRALLPSLVGELRLRALRWLGVCEVQLGLPGAIEHIEEARVGYMVRGDAMMGARITQTLSAIYLTMGEHREALRMLDVALPLLGQDSNQRPYLTALSTLADLQIQSRLYLEAQLTLDQAIALAGDLGDDFNRVRLLLQLAVLRQLKGDVSAFLAVLDVATSAAEACGNDRMYVSAQLLRADHESRMGDHVRALEAMIAVYEHGGSGQITTRLVEALLMRRRDNLPGSYTALQDIRKEAEAQGHTLEALRAWLHAVFTLYLMRHFAAVKEQLPGLIEALLRFGVKGGPFSLRNDFQEVSELLVYARLDPASAPLLASLLEDASTMLGGAADLLTPGVTLELLTLGQQTVILNGTAMLEHGQRGVVAVLTYVALHPNSTRNDIQLDLFPGKVGETGSRYVRRAFDVIQKMLGSVLLTEGHYHAPTYRFSAKVQVHLDTHLLLNRLTNNDVIGALDVFRGEFLPGFDDSEWVVGIRERLQASVKVGLEGLIRSAELDGDDQRVIVICNHALQLLTHDLDFMDRRIDAAKRIGDQQAVARYKSERNLVLN